MGLNVQILDADHTTRHLGEYGWDEVKALSPFQADLFLH